MAGFDRKIYTATATIANGASLSGAVDLNNAHLVGIVMPSGWTAASLTFQVSRDGGVTFADYYSATAEYEVTTAAASRSIGFAPADFAGVDAIKVRSGTSGTPVNQGAARVLTLVSRVYA